MIDLKRLRHDPEGFRQALRRRGDAAVDAQVDRLLALDRRRRQQVVEVETLQAARRAATEEVARRKHAGQAAEALLAELKGSAGQVKRLEAALRDTEAELDAALLDLPNPPHPEVPEGDATANRELRRWGERPEFAFEPRPHWELGQRLGLFDLPRGAKISGSGFPLFRGRGARLVRALANFMLDLHTGEHGYTEVCPPYLVTRATMTGTGQLPKFAEEMYAVPSDDLFLIPTAEVPLTNLYRDELLDAAALPIALVACTPCFRREAGSHGQDTRGLIRVHQFDKVELVRLVAAAESEAEHRRLTGHAEAVLQRLELPYRVIELAAGDTGFSAARTFDLEVWAPGCAAWLEVSSASSFTDFQARRANLRYRPAPGAKPELVHTLNASGVAFPRAIAALLEIHQAADGSVRIPEALAPYVGTDRLAPA